MLFVCYVIIPIRLFSITICNLLIDLPSYISHCRMKTLYVCVCVCVCVCVRARARAQGYIYIYSYICVCVCECVFVKSSGKDQKVKLFPPAPWNHVKETRRRWELRITSGRFTPDIGSLCQMNWRLGGPYLRSGRFSEKEISYLVGIRALTGVLISP